MSKQIDFPPATGPCDLLVIAGEASGDEHAARLIEDLLQANPRLHISAMGGNEVGKAGAEVIFPLAEHAVVGLMEVIKNYPFFRKIFKRTIAWIEQARPRCVLLVDYPGFNLRLAKALCERGISKKGGGDTSVLQYISPQLWAWKPNRRFGMAETLDALGVIFPFEKDCYADVSLPVSFVGHPFAHPSYQSSVRYDASGGLLLLPGSRVQAVSRILPRLLDAFETLTAEGRGVHGLLPVSDEAIHSLVESMLQKRPNIEDRIKIVDRNSDLPARAALMSSGTMSLSCAWAGIPGVIAYRAHPITYLIGKLLVGVPHLGMANLLLPDDPPNPEFLQSQANGFLLALEVGKLLDDPHSGNKAWESAKCLHGLLTQTKGQGAAQWLIQEGKLG
ncbi:MAG: lipid-A-disaccharide synthase [Opitutae bacterium]